MITIEELIYAGVIIASTVAVVYFNNRKDRKSTSVEKPPQDYVPLTTIPTPIVTPTIVISDVVVGEAVYNHIEDPEFIVSVRQVSDGKVLFADKDENLQCLREHEFKSVFIARKPNTISKLQ